MNSPPAVWEYGQTKDVTQDDFVKLLITGEL